MAQIIVLTNEAKVILQGLIFKRINEIGNDGSPEVDILHKIYSDVVNTQR